MVRCSGGPAGIRTQDLHVVSVASYRWTTGPPKLGKGLYYILRTMITSKSTMAAMRRRVRNSRVLACWASTLSMAMA